GGGCRLRSPRDLWQDGEEVSHSDGRPLCRRRGRSLKRAPVGGGCTPRHRARRRRVTDQGPMRLQPQSTRALQRRPSTWVYTRGIGAAELLAIAAEDLVSVFFRLSRIPSLRAGTPPTPAAPRVLLPISSPGTLAFPE